MSVPVDAARDAELKTVEFATNSSIYNVRSGNPGLSLSEANLMWKDHVVAQNTAWTWLATLKAGLATCIVLIILMMWVKCFITWRQSRPHELDIIRENQVRLTSQLAQTQGDVLRSDERLEHRVRMSSLLERREELERGVASDEALADSPLLESPVRRNETYQCGGGEKEKEVRVEDTKMYRVGPQFEDTYFSSNTVNEANRCLYFFIIKM